MASREQQLEESYEACRLITKQYAKTFYFATKFFDEDKQKAVCAVYAWCRRTDDIVDKPRKETVSLRTELDQWPARLRDVWRGRAYDQIDLALVDTVQKYPELQIEPFEDMIKGMVMDLDQNRFETFEELYVYCYRVAGTVGLMMMPIMGTAPGRTYEEALQPALALGVALQLTNILRDVGEDRVRQRIYLPQEDLRQFGVTEAALLKGVKDEKYVAMLKFQIARARLVPEGGGGHPDARARLPAPHPRRPGHVLHHPRQDRGERLRQLQQARVHDQAREAADAAARVRARRGARARPLKGPRAPAEIPRARIGPPPRLASATADEGGRG